jgi:hypothetical protein
MENEEGISSGYREKDFAVVNFLALLLERWNRQRNIYFRRISRS